ncbi:Fanconi anemia core complex-associated protein 20 isoform A [Alligator mississippiensis]|uniref:Fanconi anemia core complex-associated protein 20 isoform A n=1 Tax=Alligator mississippiensis TaxID=8496 RepID=A0A151N421_ALLMI|nr:Fanconi anemia core complex-associated protein 20 isoform A [Alligator mississippiensis]
MAFVHCPPMMDVSYYHKANRTLPGRTSWFEQEGLTASENMWMLLLKAVNADLKPTSWKMVPSLPEFSGKVVTVGH